ncbi:hypothetical protein OV450_8345 [Actinobacteria bacterium OV450]|nr:hypothetical protein OV450_8345 [Actinobacteria bacterium OV450]
MKNRYVTALAAGVLLVIGSAAPALATGTKMVVTCVASVHDDFSPAITNNVQTINVTGSTDLVSCTEALVDASSGATISSTVLLGLDGSPVATGVLNDVQLHNGTCTSTTKVPPITPTFTGDVNFTWHDAAGGSSTLHINDPLVATVAGVITFAATNDSITASSSRYTGFHVTAVGLTNPALTGSCILGTGVTDTDAEVMFTFTSP